MIAYLDASVVLRLVLGERGRLAEWKRVETAVASALTEVECLRTLDRLSRAGSLSDEELAERRTAVYRLFEGVEVVDVSRPILRRASLPDSAPLSGAIARIAVPRDGSWIVYRSGALFEPTSGLWIRRRDNLTSTRLAGTQGAQSPFVSPNGETVAYFANNALWTVPVTGGSPVKISEGTFAENGGSWGPEDVLYVDGPGPSPLQKVRGTPGSVPEPFTRLDTTANETDHVSPEVLPGGEGVIFVTRIGGYETWEVAVADIKTGAHRRLTRGVYARYAQSGHLLIVTASGILTAARFDARSMQVLGPPVSLGDRVGLRGFSGRRTC